jgi:hypothetical protein
MKMKIGLTNVVELMYNREFENLLFLDPFHNDLLVVEAFDIVVLDN